VIVVTRMNCENNQPASRLLARACTSSLLACDRFAAQQVSQRPIAATSGKFARTAGVIHDKHPCCPQKE
jgi:hypothetical protein